MRVSRGVLAGVILLVLFAGCNSVEKRIRENPEVFLNLEPAEQALIREEKVAIGFTPEMVEIAWGKPDVRETTRTAEGETETWIWINRQSVYAGRRFAGFSREVFYDEKGGRYRTFSRPVYVNVYRTVESEAARVDFREGEAVAITRAE